MTHIWIPVDCPSRRAIYLHVTEAQYQHAQSENIILLNRVYKKDNIALVLLVIFEHLISDVRTNDVIW